MIYLLSISIWNSYSCTFFYETLRCSFFRAIWINKSLYIHLISQKHKSSLSYVHANWLCCASELSNSIKTSVPSVNFSKSLLPYPKKKKNLFKESCHAIFVECKAQLIASGLCLISFNLNCVHIWVILGLHQVILGCTVDFDCFQYAACEDTISVDQ